MNATDAALPAPLVANGPAGQPAPAAAGQASEYGAAHDRPGKPPVDWAAELRGLALMLLAVLSFHTFIAKPFYIPSVSMVPNLLVGDRLVVSKYPYGWNWSSVSFHLAPRAAWRVLPDVPEYGDVVIVTPPNRTEDWIKRVIGRPGDRIAVRGGQIILNGQPVAQKLEPPVELAVDDTQMCENERSCLAAFDGYRVRLPSGREVYAPPTYRETLPNGATYRIVDHLDQTLDDFAEMIVPAGHVFVMGDNRDHSADSRAPLAMGGLGGPVPLENIGGRAEFVTFSLDGTTGWNPATWWPSVREGRSWTTLRPARVGTGT